MIGLGVDPTDPTSKGVCGFAVIRRSPTGRTFSRVALGTLDRGRECDELVEIIERHRVELVAVEVALDLFEGSDKPPQARKAINRALLRQNILAGALLHAARVHMRAKLGEIGVDPLVTEIDSATWRSTLMVRRQKHPITGKPEPYDHAVERTIRFWLPDWPRESNVHERDAAGVILGAMLDPHHPRG